MLMLISLTSALAQTTAGEAPAMNAQHFRPTIDGDRTLWADDSLRGPDKTLGWRAVMHYADDPMVYEFIDGSHLDVVGSVLQADLMASAALGRLRLGAVAPVYLLSTSDVATGSAGLGDLALEAKGTALDRDSAPVGLAGSLRVSIPTSTVDTSLGSRNVGWEASAIADRTFGPVLLAANLGVRGGPRTELEGATLNDYVTTRLAAGYAVSDDTGAALEFASQVALVPDALNPAEWMLGGYHHLGSGVTLRGGGGAGITSGVMAPDYRLVLGLAYEPERRGPKDMDRDGWTDDVDPCPAEPEDDDGVADDGCPEPDPTVTLRVIGPDGRVVHQALAVVSDGKNQFDAGPEDDRVLAPGKYTVTATAPGYSPGLIEVVVNGDEGRMTIDVPLEVNAGTVRVQVVDTDGNPVAAVIEVAGQVVATADAWTGSQQTGKALVKVTAAGFHAHKGQIDVQSGEESVVQVTLEAAVASLDGDRIDIRESVFFDTARASIQAKSFGLLDEVAALLVAHPELTKLRVEGHTDSRGNADYNKNLSQQRAESVVTYLIGKGVAQSRLTATGYGEEKPLDGRNISEAHERNRRVDFFVVDRAE